MKRSNEGEIRGGKETRNPGDENYGAPLPMSFMGFPGAGQMPPGMSGLYPMMPQMQMMQMPPGMGYGMFPDQRGGGPDRIPSSRDFPFAYGGPATESAGNPTNSQSTSLTLAEENSRRSRGNYKCSKCGLPKKGHVCAYQPKIRRRGESASIETFNAAVQVEIDPDMTIRNLKLDVQGTPESYAVKPELLNVPPVGLLPGSMQLPGMHPSLLPYNPEFLRAPSSYTKASGTSTTSTPSQAEEKPNSSPSEDSEHEENEPSNEKGNEHDPQSTEK